MQITFTAFFSTKTNDGIKDLTDTLCKRLVEISGTTEEEPCEAGTTEKNVKLER
jgi:hypothetical protein